MPDAPKAPAKTDWAALSLPVIEPKPKRIIRDRNFVVAIQLNGAQERDYVRLISLIKVGGDLSGFYRTSDTYDRLLADLQVVHLHLGGSASDAIVYAVQYPKHVLLIRVDTHIHLDDLPAGKNLNLLGRRAFEAQLEAEAVDRSHNLAKGIARLVKSKEPKAPPG